MLTIYPYFHPSFQSFVLKELFDISNQRFYGPISSRLDLLCASGVMSVITFITYTVDAILMIVAGNRGEFEY